MDALLQWLVTCVSLFLFQSVSKNWPFVSLLFYRYHFHMWVSSIGGIPKWMVEWFILEIRLKWMIWGYFHFRKLLYITVHYPMLAMYSLASLEFRARECRLRRSVRAELNMAGRRVMAARGTKKDRKVVHLGSYEENIIYTILERVVYLDVWYGGRCFSTSWLLDIAGLG